MARPRLLRTILLAGAMLWSSAPGFGQSEPAATELWHEDAEAGIRFPHPWHPADRKTPAQIQNLIRSRRDIALGEGERFTSGLYSASPLPFLLVWVRRDAEPPTRAALNDAGFSMSTLQRIRDLRTKGEMKVRLVTQVMRGQTTFVALYHTTKTEASAFDAAMRRLEVDASLRLTSNDLPRGRPTWGLTLVVASLAFAGAWGARYWYLYRRVHAFKVPPM